jgi:hypothetical protein
MEDFSCEGHGGQKKGTEGKWQRDMRERERERETKEDDDEDQF